MKRKYPFVRQERVQDCGVACLAMIIAYYKGHIPIARLRELTHTNKEGTTAYHLIKAAEELGMQAKGVHCPIELLAKATLPAIAHVTIDETYQHYIVIYEVDLKKQQVLLADPNQTIFQMSFDEFRKIYHSILILFYPTQPLPRMKNETNIRKQIVTYLRGYRTTILFSIIGSIVLMLGSILSSFYFQILLESVKVSMALQILSFFLFFILMKNGVQFFYNRMLLRMNIELNEKLTCDTFLKILKLPYANYRTQTTGDLVSRIQDIYMIQEVINQFTTHVFVDIFILIFSLICLAYLSTKLFLLVLVVLLIHLVFLTVHHRKTEEKLLLLKQREVNVHSYMIEQITGFEMSAGFSNQHVVFETFQGKYQKYLHKLFQFQMWKSKKLGIQNLSYDILYVVMVFMGCIQIKNGSLTIGAATTFQFLFLYLLEPLNRIFELFFSLKEAKQAWMRIEELQEMKSNGNIPIHHTIQFRNLSYIQDGIHPILKQVDWIIPEGRKILLLGSSGSGKSTLLKIIKGYFSTHQCFIDSSLIEQCETSQVIYIPQNAFLNTGSVYDNICLGQSISETKFQEIWNLCELSTIVQNSNLNEHMLIEENGFNISGGEKQRIVLARALLQPFSVLLLDEATSQMDHNLERRILKKMFNQYKKQTIIVVSHRTENMDLYDEVVEMNQGKIERIIKKEESL